MKSCQSATWAPFKKSWGRRCLDRFGKSCLERRGKKIKAARLGQSSKGFGLECWYESGIGYRVRWVCIPSWPWR